MAYAVARSGLTERTVAGIRDVLGGKARWSSPLLFAGPAVIASIAYMDPGNFATNIQAGAKYGYSLLWVVLLANLIAMLFQALSAKLGIVTGRNLAEMCRDCFPKPIVWAMWVVSEVAAMATDLAEFLGGAPPALYGHGADEKRLATWIYGARTSRSKNTHATSTDRPISDGPTTCPTGLYQLGISATTRARS